MDLNRLYIITDFDHTLTDKKSESSWGVLESSDLLPIKYQKICEKYKDYYMPIEKNTKITKKEKATYMKEWLEKNLAIFIKNKLTRKDIEKISLDKKIMKLRKGTRELIKFTNKNNIPLIIISAGIGDIIENYLRVNDLLYDNVHILSNKIKYEDDIITGFTKNPIHSLNKMNIQFPKSIREKIKDKDEVIIIGDNIEDIIKVSSKKQIKIGYLNGHKENLNTYKQYFDIVLDKEPISDIIKYTHD